MFVDAPAAPADDRGVKAATSLLGPLLTLVITSWAGSAAAAPAAPSGPHPRIFLSAKVRTALMQAAADPNSGMAKLIARCQTAIDKPTMFTGSGYQGDNWAGTASACALAYQLTGDAKYAAPGITLWRAMLEDITNQGDKKACVAGAAEAAGVASIRRDTGYAIRFIGPHTALTYDWLHDAPGVTEALRQQTRDCFRHWMTYYTREGYLRAQPGANYNAGFVVAKTFIAVAEGGEDGAAGDKIWTETVDDIFTKQLLGNGLAKDTGGVPTGMKKGVLVGGDWAEGWQYGPLSVIEYAAAARALIEQGVDLSAMAEWNGSLALRAVYGLLPDRKTQFVGGDWEGEVPFAKPQVGPFDATSLGNSNDEAAGWAAGMRAKVFAGAARDSIWAVLADSRGVAPVDPTAAGTTLPLWYLARGTRNLYTRSSWADDAYWSVFSSSPRQVDDHQQLNATNFVFARGGDALIVDPTPYGSRSSLNANAITMDSARVGGDYAPSQTPWGAAELPLARGTKSGVVAARGDITKAFNFQDKISDLMYARRDWVFLPEGELVTIDRGAGSIPTQKLYLRFRTPGTLTGSTSGPLVARADVGASSIAIHAVKLSPATPPVIRAAPVGTACPYDKLFGACRIGTFATTEYSYEAGAAEVIAVHVLDGLPKGEAAADVAPIDAAPIDTTPAQNAGVVGASIFRANKQTFVLEPATLPAPATLTYGVPGTNPSRHVVFDAPADGSGATNVTAKAESGRCVVTMTAGTGVTGSPAIFTVGTAAEGCTVSEDADVKPGTVSPGSGGFDKPAGGGPTTGSGTGNGTGNATGNAGMGGGGSGLATGSGCGCDLSGAPGFGAASLALATLAGVLARRRRTR